LNAENTHNEANEAELRTQLEASRKRLDGLTSELRAIDAGLEELADERQHYTLLHESCVALEKLEAQDAADLFWNGLTPADAGRSHIRVVRERVDEFEHRLNGIETSRQEVLAKIGREQDNGEFLEDDLCELERLEEDRKLEWLPERDMDESPDRPPVMPWTRGGEDDRRLRKALAIALLASLVLGVIFPWIPLPIPDRLEMLEVPDRFTKLIREEQVSPPPVQEKLRPEEKTPEAVEETPLLADEGTPEPVAKNQEPKPGAGSKGILAFREKFSSLADSATPAQLGSQARISNPGEVQSGQVTRSLVTTTGPGSSGGIDLASLSRNVGGGGGQGIEGVQVARATSSIGALGGNSDRPLSGGPGSSRTDEEIQIVFDRHKAALYRLYNRELRKDPTLQGQMVLRMTIEADGSVSMCELKSTSMKAPRLAAQVVDRVKTFDFGAKDGIPAITILYPIDFLPAS
jgi:hypothetical protein